MMVNSKRYIKKYLSALQLKQENTLYTEAFILNLCIKDENKKVSLRVYDKETPFHFLH